MGLMDMEFGSGARIGQESSWYSDDVWDDVYNTSFDLPGTSTDDPGWWKTVTDAAGTLWKGVNTPVGSSLVSGVAEGILGSMSSNDRTKAYNRLLDDKIQTRAAHNASIAKPYKGSKKVTFNAS